MAKEIDTTKEVVVAWAPIWVTLLVSVIQGAVFFAFFLNRRKKDMAALNYDIFEPRQYTRSHRSPPAFAGGKGMFNWAVEAWKVSDDDLLKDVGLDSYMFLRFLRLATRMTLLGTVLSVVLIPVYATGELRGPGSEAFNQLTLARVDAGSTRLWAPLIAWCIFVAFVLREFWTEWKLFAKNRYDFLAKGDVDTPPDFRYAVRVENIPKEMQTNSSLRAYFEKIFPSQIRQVSVCLFLANLDKLVGERKMAIVKLEKAIAFTKAKPDKPAPQTKVDAKFGVCGGTKVEAIPHFQAEIERLNQEIDKERASLFELADGQTAPEVPEAVEQPNDEKQDGTDQVKIGLADDGSVKVIQGQEEGKDAETKETDGEASSTAYITLTSLKAKQAAVQCEISGQKDRVDVFPASEPAGVIWENVTTPLPRQKATQLLVAVFWMVGVLFWAVPVSFVTSIANLNGILKSLGLGTADPNAFWYGLVSGILPVVALIILMAVLYIVIELAASKVIRKKSMPEVDAYTLYWHMMFQFANLWLILIGGSLFNQLDSIIEASSIVDVIARALPGASVFLMNMTLVNSFGAWGLELSCLVAYEMTVVMSLIQPEAQRTQRMLDDARKPLSVQWGKIIPPIVFIYLVAILYMTIVPLISVAALVFFAGSYIVWKHQCLHVYATEFEGGGNTTWLTLFGFLLASLYMGEVVFIAYMGIKEGPTQSVLGIIPLVCTILVNYQLNRSIRQPLTNLSLEVSAEVDEKEGEVPAEQEPPLFSESIDKQLYGQPALKPSLDEREPLPYRRDEVESENLPA